MYYVHFRLDDDAVERFGAGPVQVAIADPDYNHTTELSPATLAELLTDVRRNS